jgi:hypothetical protein
MSVPQLNDSSSIVLVDYAYGWYRGPDGQCYPVGWRPGYHGGGYYGHARWHRDYYEPYPMPYRRYPYYGQSYECREDEQ